MRPRTIQFALACMLQGGLLGMAVMSTPRVPLTVASLTAVCLLTLWHEWKQIQKENPKPWKWED